MDIWEERRPPVQRLLHPDALGDAARRDQAAAQDGHEVPALSVADDSIVHDYQADARTQGPLVPEEVAARMRWAGNYILPGAPSVTTFWAGEIVVGQAWAGPGSDGMSHPYTLPPGVVVIRDVLIDTSEWQMQQRQGAQMPVLVNRRRTWRRELHLFGAVLLWAEISSKQREQARG